MTPGRAERLRQWSARHSASALQYRRNAEALWQQGEQESAGALLYEAAKRCVNAIANLQGNNPVKATAKFQALLTIAEQAATDFNLISGWQSASNLHSHADQGHLTDVQFRSAWETTQTFITEMLTIFDRGQ